MPRLLWLVAVIASAVGIAFGAAELFEVSFAGTILRESPLGHRAARESLPLRDAFSVLFFVSVGMLFEAGVILEEPGKLACVLAIEMLGKTLAAIALVLAFRYPLNNVVAEQNRQTVEALRARRILAVAGDASEPEVIIQAHIARAGLLIVATARKRPNCCAASASAASSSASTNWPRA